MDPRKLELLNILQMIADLKKKLEDRKADLQRLRAILHSSLDNEEVGSYASAMWTKEFLELDYEIDASEQNLIEAQAGLLSAQDKLKKELKKEN